MDGDGPSVRPTPTAPPMNVGHEDAANESLIPPEYQMVMDDKPPPYSEATDPLYLQQVSCQPNVLEQPRYDPSSIQMYETGTSQISTQGYQPSRRPARQRSTGVKPSTYLGFSVFTMLFCNIICGLVAVIFSCQSDSEWTHGHPVTARRHSRTALCCNICAVITGLLTIALGVVTALVLLPMLKEHLSILNQ